MSRFDAIIFDMDGVLFDSVAAHELAFHEILRPFAIVDFKYESLAGMRTDEALIRLFAERNIVVSDEEMRGLVSRKRQIAYEKLKETRPLPAGLGELLQRLSAKVTLALASSASSQTVELFLSLSQTGSLFSLVLHGQQVSKAKPHPEIYLTAARLLGIAPIRGLVVEDAESGIVAAHRAGMPVLHYLPSPGRELPSLSEAPLGRIHRLEEIFQWLE